MAIGDGTARPSRRGRIETGERGTAPIAYLPGAADAIGDQRNRIDSSEGQPLQSGSAPFQKSASAQSDGPQPGRPHSNDRQSGRLQSGRNGVVTRGAHPAGTRRGERDAIGDDLGASGASGRDGDGTASGGRDTPSEPDRRERRAANVSMSALTRRGMSRWELEKTLVSRELEPEVVDAELERLESVGLIDDAGLAEMLVRTQHERKGLGRSALVAELRRRHIDQEHIDAALEQVDDDDESSRARELAERRARQLTSLDRETAVRRLTGYLLRKGYSSSIVRAAVDEALGGRDGGGVRFR